MFRRALLFIVVWLALPGCYASHERAGAVLLSCGAPAPSCPDRATTLPRGVCVSDGDVFVFADGTRELVCTGTDGDATRFGRVDACGASAQISRHAACCPPSRDSFLTGWVFEGPVVGASTRVVLDVDGCVLLSAEIPRERYAPWRPTTLCDDPLGWSGVPLVFSVRVPDADPCNGAEQAERCSATLVDDRIVVTTESAAAYITVCETAVGDRVAECAVGPLAAGSYDVVDDAGRALGVVEVPDAPGAPREPRCVPIPP